MEQKCRYCQALGPAPGHAQFWSVMLVSTFKAKLKVDHLKSELTNGRKEFETEDQSQDRTLKSPQLFV